jgi:hypothetical protein
MSPGNRPRGKCIRPSKSITTPASIRTPPRTIRTRPNSLIEPDQPHLPSSILSALLSHQLWVPDAPPLSRFVRQGGDFDFDADAARPGRSQTVSPVSSFLAVPHFWLILPEVGIFADSKNRTSAQHCSHLCTPEFVRPRDIWETSSANRLSFVHGSASP